jgi:hypothetical protein
MSETVSENVPVDYLDIPSPVEQVGPERYKLAFEVLGNLLELDDGCVSSLKLRRELESKHGFLDAGPVLVELKIFDPQLSAQRGIPTPTFKFHHYGRSFYSDKRYAEEIEKQEQEADNASDQASTAEPEEVVPSAANRQEEARVVSYVKSALEEIYSSDANEDENEFAFDVHSLRKGSGFENADLVAVHWQAPDVYELVAVEVKLEFTAQAVQQALNYARFVHRAWVACLVESDSNLELRERNPALFEYAVSRGVGVLACRRSQGRGYKVRPIHWPSRSHPALWDEKEFLGRYRPQFEDAGILERPRRPLPRSR